MAPASFPALATHFNGSMLNDTNSSGESHTRNGRPRGDARGRNQLLPRYWPRKTDQELQQVSGDSNSVITPLFEQTLSASDAGEIERIVVPKECAEAYFPSISQPQGLPLKVQDAKGSEWIFQFKFWPNNNSRMYVLEGVTPCIQSLQLEAGDKVTFSRLEPVGKLVMALKKASTAPPSDQCAELGPGEGLLQPGVLGGQAGEAQEGNLKLGPVEKLENGIAGPNSDGHLNPCKINPQQSTSVKEDPSSPPYGLAVPHASGNEPNGHIGLVGPHLRPAPSPTLAKRSYGSMLNDTNSSGESHTRNKRPRGDARGRNQLIPRD